VRRTIALLLGLSFAATPLMALAREFDFTKPAPQNQFTPPPGTTRLIPPPNLGPAQPGPPAAAPTADGPEALPESTPLRPAQRFDLNATQYDLPQGTKLPATVLRELTYAPGDAVTMTLEVSDDVRDGQGEVIGLFLTGEIPRGMSFADTIAAIRAQGGLVYLPHPFDRMHTIPDPATLQRHLAEIDVFEVYNARLLFEAYNEEALRFARKYNLTKGAGSDAHVLAGVGTGAVRMRAFRSPEELLISLRTAEILRRPRSLAYLQALKWTAQVKEKVR